MTARSSTATRANPPALILAAALGATAAATAVLWVYYGTAVFFEMVRNGWTACF